jgi:hypothetical protein
LKNQISEIKACGASGASGVSGACAREDVTGMKTRKIDIKSDNGYDDYGFDLEGIVTEFSKSPSMKRLDYVSSQSQDWANQGIQPIPVVQERRMNPMSQGNWVSHAGNTRPIEQYRSNVPELFPSNRNVVGWSISEPMLIFSMMHFGMSKSKAGGLAVRFGEIATYFQKFKVITIQKSMLKKMMHGRDHLVNLKFSMGISFSRSKYEIPVVVRICGMFTLSGRELNSFCERPSWYFPNEDRGALMQIPVEIVDNYIASIYHNMPHDSLGLWNGFVCDVAQKVNELSSTYSKI